VIVELYMNIFFVSYPLYSITISMNFPNSFGLFQFMFDTVISFFLSIFIIFQKRTQFFKHLIEIFNLLTMIINFDHINKMINQVERMNFS